MWKTCLQPWAWTWCPRPRPFNMGVAFSSPLRRPLLVIPYRSLKIIRPIIQMLVNWTTVLRKIIMVRLISQFFFVKSKFAKFFTETTCSFFCQFFEKRHVNISIILIDSKWLYICTQRETLIFFCHFSFYVRIAKHACFWDSDLALKLISRKIWEWRQKKILIFHIVWYETQFAFFLSKYVLKTARKSS